MNAQPDSQEPHGAPEALLEEKARVFHRLRGVLSTRLWLATAGCALVAAALLFSAWGGKQVEIGVSFQNGHGLKPSDALRYRGIVVGEVTAVHLEEDMSRLRVEIRLESRADGLAREGAEFWIVRPEVTLARVRGLDTVVGANYVEARPGPPAAPRQLNFVGLESPPRLGQAGVVEIAVGFRDGRGLRVGDAVKHLGIEVGEVTQVSLNKEFDGVRVSATLSASAAQLARRGTQFWIERPSVSIAGVRGLDTVVAGRHIALLPGPAEAEQLTTFDGLEEPPTLPQRPAAGLEFILESSQRHGLTRGAPLKFRGIEVGRITSLGLSSDAAQVEARVFVAPEYRQLIRANTRFWATSGMGFEWGFRGLQLDVDSLASLAAGGVALATPEPLGTPVTTGHRFTLLESADPDALTQQARIPLGSSLLPGNLPLPQPLRTTFRWTKNGWINSTREVDGWALLLAGRRLLLLDELTPPSQGDDAQRGGTLSVAGRELATRLAANLSGGLRVYDVSPLADPQLEVWPPSRMRAPQGPEDCLLVADPLSPPLPLSAARLRPTAGGWHIDAAVSLGDQWQGAFVVSRADGALIGLVRIEKSQNIISVLGEDAGKLDD